MYFYNVLYTLMLIFNWVNCKNWFVKGELNYKNIYSITLPLQTKKLFLLNLATNFCFFFHFQLFAKKHWKSIFRPAFGMGSTQMLVKIYSLIIWYLSGIWILPWYDGKKWNNTKHLTDFWMVVRIADYSTIRHALTILQQSSLVQCWPTPGWEHFSAQ